MFFETDVVFSLWALIFPWSILWQFILMYYQTLACHYLSLVMPAYKVPVQLTFLIHRHFLHNKVETETRAIRTRPTLYFCATWDTWHCWIAQTMSQKSHVFAALFRSTKLFSQSSSVSFLWNASNVKSLAQCNLWSMVFWPIIAIMGDSVAWWFPFSRSIITFICNWEAGERFSLFQK